MSFDALTLTAVRDELEPALTGARMQRLAFADELSLVIECFAPGAGRTYVLLSAHSEQARVEKIGELPARGIEGESPWILVCRKHLRNARIRSLRQPPLERVLELDCEQRDASGQHYKVLLIVEAMGRRSNLVLVAQDGTIIDAARRTPPSRNARRPILPHLPYEPPPPQERLLPWELTLDTLAQGAGTGLLAKHLAERIAGLSPQAGRELAFRATGALDAACSGADWQAVLDTVQTFFEPLRTHDWQPTLATREEQPLAYAPYRLSHLAAAGAHLQPFQAISEAMNAYYAGEPLAKRGDPLAGERKQLLASIDQQAHTAERRIGALQQQLDQGESQRDPLRRAGELILTYLPANAERLEVEGESVALDPELSASENAQVYFARYRKAREAAERVPALLDAARQQAELLAELRTMVELASDMNAIRALRGEVRGEPVDRQKHKQRSAPFRRLSLGDGFEALIGTSAEGNAHVTFDLASADDLWLHVRGAPGAHVILRGRDEPSAAVLERTAELAAWFSANRTSSRVEVDIAPRRHVRKIPNGPPGLVRYTHERTVRVAPRAPAGATSV